MFRRQPTKYGNSKFKNQYGEWDSKKEYEYYLLLLHRLKMGEISELHRQVEYELIPKQTGTKTKQLKTKTKEVPYVIEKACTYKADFTYVENGELRVVDTKGFRTKEYIIKRKLMLWRHGIKIIEV